MSEIGVRGVPAFKPRSDIIEAVILEKLCDAYPHDSGGRPEALDLCSPEGRRGKLIKLPSEFTDIAIALSKL
jgi:hypothetical protein